MGITFATLYDALTGGGLRVGVDLGRGTHRIVIEDPSAPRVIRFAVRGDFDQAARVLVLSVALREALRQRSDVACDRAGGRDLITGSWPELVAMCPANSARRAGARRRRL